jgi:hypothetical protein
LRGILKAERSERGGTTVPEAKKDPVKVTIFTRDHRIDGTMYVYHGGRLTDTLNAKTKDFYPITDAKVYRLDTGELVASPEYLAVARDGLFLVYPQT